MSPSEGKELTKRFEGFRDRVYKDHLGNPTCGWGTHLYVGRRVPVDVLERLFDDDYRRAEDGYEALHLHLDPVRRAVITDMIYNIGMGGFLKFKRLISALQDGDYERAAAHMTNSRWYDQVGRRARELVYMMQTGQELADPSRP